MGSRRCSGFFMDKLYVIKLFLDKFYKKNQLHRLEWNNNNFFFYKQFEKMSIPIQHIHSNAFTKAAILHKIYFAYINENLGHHHTYFANGILSRSL